MQSPDIDPCSADPNAAVCQPTGRDAVVITPPRDYVNASTVEPLSLVDHWRIHRPGALDAMRLRSFGSGC